MSEANSYLRIAHHLSLFPNTSARKPFPRATTEDFSLDSYQNVIFSIARFKEFTSHYPSKITVVGFGFKKRRFEELHRRALRWPIKDDTWNYLGVDLEGENREEHEGEVWHLSALLNGHSLNSL